MLACRGKGVNAVNRHAVQRENPALSLHMDPRPTIIGMERKAERREQRKKCDYNPEHGPPP